MAKEEKLQNDTNGLQFPPVVSMALPTHTDPPIPLVGELTDGSMYPQFVRKRFAPPRHLVVVEEVDR